VPNSEAMSDSPVFGDYLTAAWRRRYVVLAAIVAGGVLGAVVVPLATSNTRTYAASQRVDIKAFGSEKAPSAGTSGKGSGNGDARYADPTVMSAALASLGPAAGHLAATGNVRTSNRAVAALSHLSAKAITGTSWVDLTYTDKDITLAQRVIHAYVTEYVKARNKAAASATTGQIATLSAQANTEFKQVAAWSRQADAERQASPAHVTSALTLAQLQVATKQYQSTVAALTNAQAQGSLRGQPTAEAGPVIVRTVKKPTSRRVLLVAGVVLGLIVGVGAAAVLETFRRRIASSSEAEELTGLPLLGVIPTSSAAHKRLAVTAKPHGASAEAIQRTRGAIQLAGLGESVSVLAVLSSEGGSGKSSFVMNLAQSIANQGTLVVVVSANLRDRALDRFHGTLGNPGLAQLLDGSMDDPTRLLVEIGPNNYLLPAGRTSANPSELFTRAVLTGIFARLAEVGLVIVDTPAALDGGEVMAIAGAADASILLARVGHATKTGLQTTALDLRRLNLPCLGLVGVGDNGRTPSLARVAPVDVKVAQRPARVDLDAPAPTVAKPRRRTGTAAARRSSTD
jgi:Mrp family chromosome partitioning ATPase